MKVSEMNEEQRAAKRKYDREQKAKSRAAKKEAARRAQILTADEAGDSFAAEYPERVHELDLYVKEFASKVSEELGRNPQSIEEEFAIDRVGRSLLGLRRGWITRVTQPEGELVGGYYFGDACGDIIESANRLGLRKSPAFDSAYLELLALVVTRYGHIVPVSIDIQAAQAELDGTYKLPEPPESPAPAPKPAHELPVPTTAEILFSAREKLLEQVQGQQF